MSHDALSRQLLDTPPQIEDQLSQRNLKRLTQFIYDYSGIRITEGKSVMLESRLRRRLRATGLARFDDYCDFLFDDGGLEAETVHLIDVVTTNKTDFFREPNHFDYFWKQVLPQLKDANGTKTVRAWSAACSIGAEPYTLAMLLEDFRTKQHGPHYQILATDLSTDVLEQAHRGVYPADMVQPVPPAMRGRYVMQARDPRRNTVRIHPRLRSRVGFMRMNLMDAKYEIGEPMHVIFCRNVLIYFDKQTQFEVVSRLCDCLVPGGYLFIGHAESITGLGLPLKQQSNTIYVRE